MPIYEFACRSCSSQFESRVARAGDRPGACPSCGSAEFDKQLSAVAAHTAGSPGASPQSGGGACACMPNGGGCGRMN